MFILANESFFYPVCFVLLFIRAPACMGVGHLELYFAIYIYEIIKVHF